MERSPVCTAVLLCAVATPAALAQSFSLDDNPAVPISTPPGLIPGYGAENPYGPATPGPLRVVPPGPPGLAPSPTLGLPPFVFGFGDAEVMTPGPGPLPAHNVSAPSLPGGAPNHWIDALSDNSPRIERINVHFSVDRASHPAFPGGGGGLPGTAVNAQALLDQQPGDIFRSTRAFPDPGIFAGTLAGAPYAGALPTAPAIPGGNTLLIDDSALNLTVTGMPGVTTPAGMPGGPILVPGLHDNVDAFDHTRFDVTGDLTTDVRIYFSVNPDGSALTGVMAADVLTVAPGAGVATLFAPAPTLGLVPAPGLGDDLDGLVIWDLGTEGELDAGLDYALFSLSAGSPSLTLFGLDPADVFFTDFTGAFATFADALDLGLLPGPAGAPPGLFGDNIDALEIGVVPLPAAVWLLGAGFLGYLGLGYRRA